MSQQFGLGMKALKSLCEAQKPMDWHQAKLVKDMFKPTEVEAFEWVSSFVKKHHALPHVETLVGQFPDLSQYPIPEPASYYVEHLEKRLYYDRINAANIESQTILKNTPQNTDEALASIMAAATYIKEHQYRTQIVNFAKEGPQMLIGAYHNVMLMENVGKFGWQYLDKSTGGLMPGDVVTIIGRPAAGKSWLVFFAAMQNWLMGKRVLVVSMEMAPLPVLQRLGAMFAGTNISQLKLGAYSSKTFSKFTSSMLKLAKMDNDFLVVDGNLAASVEDVYILAAQMKCDQVYIDGAYLLRHPNTRLDRYTRVAENAELIKRVTSSQKIPTVASYQFARSASKDKKKNPGDVATLDDIGSSDVIGQVSTVALGLFQDDSVETLEGRIVRVLKGRNGEVGQFKIGWDFNTMNFHEVTESEAEQYAQLEYV